MCHYAWLFLLSGLNLSCGPTLITSSKPFTSQRPQLPNDTTLTDSFNLWILGKSHSSSTPTLNDSLQFAFIPLGEGALQGSAHSWLSYNAVCTIISEGWAPGF
jgi:hypothetical protein